MHDIFNSTRCYSSNSLQDLLEAREQYHYQLMNKDNVVATAIGYYRIRKADPWPTREDAEHGGQAKRDGTVRTLANSEVRPYSWPAVLVFVDRWMTEKEIYEQNPTSIIPKTLFLNDGRKVPVCIIHAPISYQTDNTVNPENLQFPRNFISGGFPLLTETQKELRVASVGCLVSDGHTTYALTNKHVAGEPGTPIYSKLAGADIRIGTVAALSIGRIPFREAYQKWPGKNTYINMDVGLIEIEDLNQWKTEVYQTGAMGRLADLHTGNFNLSLIGAKVSGYGCVSGKIRGEIQALFYRYKSVGGYEYLSDFLVGSADSEDLALHHGDSGTVLMYERENDERKVTELMPIGIVWGQHEIIKEDTKGVHPFALVNCLSLVLNRLDVDLVRGWNIDQPYTWGKVGHYTVAYKAIEAIGDAYPNLKQLFINNATMISFPREKITNALEKYKDYKQFCPLADVPDIIFKSGGTGIQRGGEKPNHYADIDLPRKKDGKSLRNLVDASKNLDVNVWSEYYNDIGTDTPHKGILPFRVWQIFKAMVQYVKAGDKVGFITAAGILTHYVGDACQPLHSSYMSLGHILNSQGQLEMYADGVHQAYEDTMLNAFYGKLLTGLDTELSKAKKTTRTINEPKDAGLAVFDLLCESQDSIPPRHILDFFVKTSKTAEKMWVEFGNDTVKVIARGCQVQARLWEAAWKLGEGDKHIKNLTRADQDKVKDLYTNHRDDFIPSVMITAISQYL